MRVYALVILCVCCNVLAQMCLKMGATRSQTRLDMSPFSIKMWLQVLSSGPILSGVALWTVSTLLWIYVLSALELSFAYSLYGLNYVLTPLLASWYFDEKLQTLQSLGMALIALGVGLTVVGRSSS